MGLTKTEIFPYGRNGLAAIMTALAHTAQIVTIQRLVFRKIS